jgi:transposase
MVHVPSSEEEDRRRRGRERERLIKERVQHLGRIKGLLMTQGVRDFRPGRRDWQERLDALRTGDGQPLPSRLKAEIGRECRRLALADEMLGGLEREREAEGETSRQVALLTKLRGIGPTSAHLLAGEVFHREFANRRQVAGYFGLEPSPWQSGSVEREQGISKAGNRRARRAAIELAWLWLQYQPDSRLCRWFKDRVGAARGRVRRILLVALARKLVVALWRYLAAGVVPEGALTRA